MSLFSIITKLMKANVMFAVLGLSISVIVARELGPLLKGELTLFLLVSSIFSLSMRFGLDTSIIRYLKIKREGFSLVKNSIYLSLMIISLVFLFVYIITQFFYYSDDFFFNKYDYYYLLYILIPLEVISIIIASYLLGSNMVNKYALSIICQPVVVLFFILSLLIFEIDLTVLNIITITVFSFFIKIIYLIFVTKNLFHLTENYNFSKSLNLLRFGIKSHIGNVIDFFIIRTDILLISFFIGLEAAGIYSIAALAEKMNIINGTIGSAVFAKIRGREDFKLVNKIIRLTIPLLLIIVLLATIFSKYFLLIIFGDSFKEAAQPFIILILGFSILFISKPMKAYLVIIDKPILLTYSSTSALVINVFLNLILIPEYGIVGAAAATTVANIVYVIVVLFFYKKNTKVSFKDIFLFKNTDFKEVLQ